MGFFNKFLKDFKGFINRGNVIDMAVGIIIGAAFGRIVNSLVNGILMPPIGALIGGVDFSDLKWTIKPAEGSQPAVTIDYGQFINTLIDFFIIALAIYALIKVLNSLQRKNVTEEIPTKLCMHCQMDIPTKASRCPHCTSEL